MNLPLINKPVGFRWWRFVRPSTGIILAGVLLLELCGCAVSRRVVVQSNPPGAMVQIDDLDKGTTPLAPIKLQWEKEMLPVPGHTLVVKADKYEAQKIFLSYDMAAAAANPWLQTITLAPLEMSVRVQFELTPDDATVSLDGGPAVSGHDLSKLLFKRASSKSPWAALKVTVTAPAFESQTLVLSPDRLLTNPVVSVNLNTLEARAEARFKVTPADALVTVDGMDPQFASKPLPLVFTRTSSTSPWATIKAVISAPSYESQTLDLNYEDLAANQLLPVNLSELQRDVPVDITANVEGVMVTVNGEKLGTAPLRHTFEFARATGNSEWNTFLVVGSKAGYRYLDPSGHPEPGEASPFSKTLTLDEAAQGTLSIKLDLMRYVITPVRRVEPSSEGVKIVTEKVLSQVGEIEREPKVGGATKISDARPERAMVEGKISVLPDGKQVVYSSPFKLGDEGNQEEFFSIWIVHGNEQIRLTDATQEDLEPSASKDGKWVYFSSNRLNHDRFNIWRMQSIGRGGLTKITDSPSSVIDTEPELSPGGDKLAYVSYYKGALPHIWVANPDGTLPTELRVGKHPAWSPKGDQIAYVESDPKGKEKIWVMDANGGSPTQLTTGDQSDLYPTWTPDGKRIVYASDQAMNEEGRHNFDIWIMSADGSGKTQLTVNGSKDTRPTVSPDGKYIYFLSNRGAQKADEPAMQIWRIDLPAE